MLYILFLELHFIFITVYIFKRAKRAGFKTCEHCTLYVPLWLGFLFYSFDPFVYITF